MKQVPLSNGGVAFVDDEDYERVMTRKWCSAKNGYIVSVKYAGRVNGKTVNDCQLLHRFVMNAQPGQTIDHKDGMPFDCRKHNLRFVTDAQNAWNSKKRHDNLSGETGVSFHKGMGRWRARFLHYGSTVHVGTYDTKEEAVAARNAMIVKYRGVNYKTTEA